MAQTPKELASPAQTMQAIQRVSFMALPTELQLEILRYALIADPPQLDCLGDLGHPLLDISNSHIHDMVEDTIFHATTVAIPHKNMMSLCFELDSFFEYHDRVHGKAKRRLIHLVVVDQKDRIIGCCVV